MLEQCKTCVNQKNQNCQSTLENGKCKRYKEIEIFETDDIVSMKNSENMKSTNPKDLVGSDKLPLHLFPMTAVVYGTMALLDGALKYGRTNWRVAGVRASIYYDACLRHITKWFEGRDIDEDSGLPHLAHALACITILIDAIEADKLKDDRMYKGGYDRLLKKATPMVKKLKEKYKDKNPKHWTIADNKEERPDIIKGI